MQPRILSIEYDLSGNELHRREALATEARLATFPLDLRVDLRAGLPVSVITNKARIDYELVNHGGLGVPKRLDFTQSLSVLPSSPTKPRR